MTPMEYNLALLEKHTPSMRYDGSEPFPVWQKRARETLTRLLGLDTFERCDPCFTLEVEEEHEAFTEYRLRYRAKRARPAIFRR